MSYSDTYGTSAFVVFLEGGPRELDIGDQEGKAFITHSEAVGSTPLRKSEYNKLLAHYSRVIDALREIDIATLINDSPIHQ